MDKPKITIQMLYTKESGHVVTKEIPIRLETFLALRFMMPDGQCIKVTTDDADGIQIFSTTGRIHVIPYAANAIRVQSVGFSNAPVLTLEVKDEEPG